MYLFPNNCSYRYVQIEVNGIGLNILINKLYNKYFNNKEDSNVLIYNTIYSKIHNNIIEDIKTYEKRITQGSAFCNIIKDELIATAFHPNRLCPLIKKYGIGIVEKL